MIQRGSTTICVRTLSFRPLIAKRTTPPAATPTPVQTSGIFPFLEQFPCTSHCSLFITVPITARAAPPPISTMPPHLRPFPPPAWTTGGGCAGGGVRVLGAWADTDTGLATTRYRYRSTARFSTSCDASQLICLLDPARTAGPTSPFTVRGRTSYVLPPFDEASSVTENSAAGLSETRSYETMTTPPRTDGGDVDGRVGSLPFAHCRSSEQSRKEDQFPDNLSSSHDSLLV